MKSHLLFVICTGWLLLLAFLRGGQLFSIFGQNLANTLIHNSFSLEQTDAITRQRAISVAATLLEVEIQGLSLESGTAHEIAMIPAALRGLYYHRLGDWENAAFWYRVAAQGEPIPELQQQILLSPWMELIPTGDFILGDYVGGWHIRADTAPGAKITRTDRGTLEFTCSEILEESKKAVLEWNQAFDIPYHHTLVLKAKAEIGTILNLETVIDGQLIRHLTHQGTGKWEEFTIPIDGDHVKYIYVIVREDRDSSNKNCVAEIDAVSFLID